jgi:carbamoyl-phosphate synthase small subunit
LSYLDNNCSSAIVSQIEGAGHRMKSATLVLQDRTVLEGLAFGAVADVVFELVFNTSMTSYREILTDPSYRGQEALFAVSHVGNVGIHLEDDESALPLSEWLAAHGVPGISGVDMHYLTRKLREAARKKPPCQHAAPLQKN